MADVWRGITFEAFRYVPLPGGDPFYTAEQYQCFFRAEGGLLEREGPLATLDCLQATVVRWVLRHWAGAFLLPAGDDQLQARAKSERPRTQQALVPTSCDLHSLAAYLLEVVCERALRERDLLVTQVRVMRAGEVEAGEAKILPELRGAYLAEQEQGLYTGAV